MKKFLSMVLALVMTMSLVTISAGAKSFTDDSKITYKEAVDVISELGIVDGYEDGAFNPTNNLTRGAAAKIICNLILGPTTASALSADTAPFVDVPIENNFAGYIAYCSQQGIISGYANGTFRPADPLTGYAFMKMLLGALGYDATKEGFTGPNWSVNVGKLALGIGLDDGNDDFVGNDPVNREEACLYAFNTLKATMVEYENQSQIVIGDITVNTSSEYKDMANTGKTDGNINDNKKMEFAEKYFTDLKLKNGEDDFARPANVWTLKAKEIGTYAKTADASYTKKVEVGDIYKDLGLSGTVAKADVEVFEDGKATNEAVAIKKGDDDNKFGGNGMLTEVFYDDDNGTVTITKVNTYVAEVVKTVDATSKKDAYVQLATMDPKPAGIGGTLEFETEEEFEDDAVVQYTYSQSAEEVKSVAETEIVTGTATKIINKNNDTDQNNGMTIDDTEYKVAVKSSGEILGSASVKNDYTIYLDQYGYILYIEEEEMSNNYALLVEAASNSTFVGKKAKLVFADGTTAVVDTDKNYNGASNKIDEMTIVSYKVDDDDVYTLKAVSSKQSGTPVSYNETEREENTTSFSLKNDRASITIEDGTPTKVTSNSKTQFVVRDPQDDEEYTAYTGIKNAPSIEAENAANKDVDVYYYCKSGNMVTIMFVMPGSALTVEDSNTKMLFIAGESVSNLMHDANSDYFEYNAVVNGEVTTVKVDDRAGLADGLNGLYASYSMDKYDVITRATSYSPYTDGEKKEVLTGTGVDKRSADYTLILDGETITVADDAVYYYVSEDGDISSSSYRAISKDDNDKFYAVIEDFLVKALFVEEVDDGKKPGPDFDARDYQVIYNTRDVSVLYNEGADNSYDTLLDVILTDLETKGYTDFSVNGATIEAKKGNRNITFTWDEDTTRKAVAVEIDDLAYLAEVGAKLDAVVDSDNNVVAAGKYAIETDKNGNVKAAEEITGITVSAGSSYDTGYTKATLAAAVAGAGTDRALYSVALPEAAAEVYVKEGDSVTVTVTTSGQITAANGSKIALSGTGLKDTVEKITAKDTAAGSFDMTVVVDSVANDIEIVWTVTDVAAP